jgi:hypothetical protein
MSAAIHLPQLCVVQLFISFGDIYYLLKFQSAFILGIGWFPSLVYPTICFAWSLAPLLELWLVTDTRLSSCLLYMATMYSCTGCTEPWSWSNTVYSSPALGRHSSSKHPSIPSVIPSSLLTSIQNFIPLRRPKRGDNT